MTQLAQQIIEDNKRSKNPTLDLGNCGLTELPDLSGMDWVETLNLGDEWWAFDEGTKKWAWIKSQNNGGQNRLEKTPPTQLHLPLLKKLFARNTGISDTRFWENLTNLTWLDLRNNQISDAHFLEKLTNLTWIGLGNNQISDAHFLEKLTGLTSLDLGNNQISDAHFLEKLTGLTSLGLSNNQISDGRFLEKLTQLTTLNLSSNQISDAHFLENLTGLTSLNLSNNQINDGRFLEKLTNLTTLDLSNNKISDWRFLENLTNLTSLFLSNNQINDGRFLEKLTNLTTLDLSNNQISDGRFLEKLTGLTSLDLSNNQISDGRFFEKLTGLTSLIFRSNPISDWRFLGNLTGLTTLDLSKNQISDGRFFEKLTGLTSLYLWSNQIGDWHFLEKLTGLKLLYLGNNQISDARFLEKLNGLTTLDLWGNQISDGRFLEKLNGLTTLGLSNNQISDTRFLEKLNGLTTLDLSNNQISDGRFLEKLTQLNKIDLGNNQFTDLVPLRYLLETKGMQVVWKEWYETTDGEINVKDNPFSNPPVEIVQQGNEAIIRYFEKFKDKEESEIRYVDEAKILLIGQPRAGKTTLRNKLRSVESGMPTDDETTRGIDIESLYFDFEDAQGRKRQFKCNVWDFGGQEIYHATHRFFLTSRSLYVAVVNTDVNDKQNDLDYWLHIVELLGGESPVLMVQNQKNNRKIDISQTLKARFEHLLKKEYKLDLNRLNHKEPTFEQKRLDDFREFEEELRLMLKRLPQTAIKVLPEELAVREAIAEMAKTSAVIPKEEFFDLCNKKGLTDPNLQTDFLHLLHELGVLLHFENNEHLERVVILQNKWATDAVFKILDAPQVAAQNGHFSKKDSDSIWNSPEYRGKGVELRELMREFKLCYQIAHSDTFIAPQLLPANPPKHHQWQASDSDLRMLVEYEFMPRGIMTQFIVGMHRDIADEQRLVWQSGFVAEPEDLPGTRAEASESYDSRRIEIKVQGPFAGLLLQRLVDELRKIHNSYQNLEPDELLPCLCTQCLILPPEQRHHFKYKSLLNSLYINRVNEKQCDKSDLPVPIERILGQAGFGKQKQLTDVMHLLDGVRRDEIRVIIDNREIREEIGQMKQGIAAIETNTHLIQSNQQVHTRLLETLLRFAEKEQTMLHGVFTRIDALSDKYTADLRRIDGHLEERFGELLEQLPDEHEIVAAWKKATEKAPDDVDMKWKLKFKLPLIFGEVEKELTWDGKKMLKSIREEITAYAKGERSFRELFWEED